MRYKIILISILFLFTKCKRSEISDDDSRFGTKVMILGHAGMGMYFNWPSNSMESIMTCIEIGCDGSEMDVQMTMDSVLVAYHDQDLSTQTNCFGNVHEHYWSEIQDCKLNRSINGGKFVRLEELFSKIGNLREYYFSFDCKLNAQTVDFKAYEMKFLLAIQRLCLKYDMELNCLIEGPEEFLNFAKSLNMKNHLFLISNNDNHPSDIASTSGYFGISIPYTASIDDLKYANGLQLRTMVWSPYNYSQNKLVLSNKPDIIQTDDPISLLKLTNRYDYESVRP